MNFIRYLCMNFSVTMNSNIIKILFLAIITVILPVEALAASPGAAAVSAPHVVILGDSNTSIGGDMCDNPKGWNKWFAEQFDSKSCRSYARSGATWTHTKSTRRNPEQNTGRLECGVAYAGTEISIGDEITRLRHEEHQCVAKMVAGEILVM